MISGYGVQTLSLDGLMTLGATDRVRLESHLCSWVGLVCKPVQRFSDSLSNFIVFKLSGTLLEVSLCC